MILVAGEALIDLTHSEGTAGFVAHPGGGPCNTAVGLGRLGVPVMFLGAVGNDVFADHLLHHMEQSGVDTSLVVPTPRPTTLALADIDAEGQAQYAFYMDGTSAAQLFPGDVPSPIPDEVTAIHVGTLGLVLEPTGTTLVALVLRESQRRVIAVDPNIRQAVIPDMEVHRARLDTVMGLADLVRLSADDAALLYPDTDPEDAARRIAASRTSLVVLSRGENGVVGFHGAERIERPVVEVDVVDTIGAGDSFNAGLLAWLHDHDRLTKTGIAGLSSDEVAAALDFAAEVAAVTVSRPGADPPRRSDLVAG